MSGPRTQFSTVGSTLKECNDAAAAIAFDALGEWYHLHTDRYTAEVTTNNNRVLVWRGEYSATSGGPR